jgi:hypothetical protein
MKNWKKVKLPPLVDDTTVSITFIKFVIPKHSELVDNEDVYGPYSSNSLKSLFALAAAEWRDKAIEAETFEEVKKCEDICDQWDRLRRQL